MPVGVRWPVAESASSTRDGPIETDLLGKLTSMGIYSVAVILAAIFYYVFFASPNL